MEKLKRQAEKRQQELKAEIKEELNIILNNINDQLNYKDITSLINCSEDLTKKLKQLNEVKKILRIIIKQKEEGAGKNEIN